MEKVVNMNDERSIKVVTDNSLSPKKEIVERFFADGMECAHYSLIQDDNYYFNADLDFDLATEENNKKLIFDIDVNHPLFFSFLHLLNGEEELIINDSTNKENESKYLSIKNEEDIITLNFVDKIKNESLSKKFKIKFDSTLDYLTSKESVKDNDTRERLNIFFEESCNLLFDGYHQIDFEEYTLSKKIEERARLSS